MGRLLLRTPGPVPLELAYVLLVETNPFSELVVICTDYALRISLCTFSILLVNLYENSVEATRALWTLSFDENNQATMIDGETEVVELFLELKDSQDAKVQKACNGALWNMRNKLQESSKYQAIGKYKRRLLLSCIRHFQSYLINNMDHMRNSGTEPSSVVLSQTKYFKALKIEAPKCIKKMKLKEMV